MKSVNKVILVGHLAADPEMRYTGTGTAVAHFRMATNETWVGKEGNKEERTEWHRVVAWGKLAEVCGEYLSKGRQIYVEGKLKTSSWETKEGEKRYSTEVTATDIVFLGGGKGVGAEMGGGSNSRPAPTSQKGGSGDEMPPAGFDGPAPVDEDVPF